MHEATRRILSVLLRQIDGFEQTKKVVVVAATNRKQDLDPALISRFDAMITFGLPDQLNRQKFIAQYAKHLTKSETEEFAQVTEGWFDGRNFFPGWFLGFFWLKRMILLAILSLRFFENAVTKVPHVTSYDYQLIISLIMSPGIVPWNVASGYSWESATPPGTALMMLDAYKMVAAASSRNPTLAGILTCM